MPKRNPLSRCAALGAAVVLAVTGCNGEAGSNGEEAPQDRLALTELGDRLDGAVEHAYTAEYLVEGADKTVTVAIDPEGDRAVVVVDDEVEMWSEADPQELSTWLSGQLTGMLPSGEEIAGWLSATSDDPSAKAEFSDTTLAGELADCVAVTGATDSPVGVYEVCVTTVGVIASVTAEVDEASYTTKLVNYHDGVDAAWLDELEPGAAHTHR